MAVQTISPQELARLREAGKRVELIDVRTPAEFDAVHAADARLVPLDKLDPKAILAARNGPAVEPIYLICQSGARAAMRAVASQASALRRGLSASRSRIVRSACLPLRSILCCQGHWRSRRPPCES